MSITLPIVYPKLPAMRCDRGCGECCGPVTCTKPEYDSITEYAASHGIAPAAQGITCPWYRDGGCSVYEVRPWVCRMMGHVPRLHCARNYDVLIGEKKERKAFEQYMRVGEPDCWLHAAVYSESETMSLLVAHLDSSLPTPLPHPSRARAAGADE